MRSYISHHWSTRFGREIVDSDRRVCVLYILYIYILYHMYRFSRVHMKSGQGFQNPLWRWRRQC